MDGRWMVDSDSYIYIYIYEMPTRPTPRKYSPIRHCPDYRGGENRIGYNIHPPLMLLLLSLQAPRSVPKKETPDHTEHAAACTSVGASRAQKMHCCDSAHLFVLVQRHAPLTKEESKRRSDEPAHSGAERDSTRTCAIPAKDNITLTR